MRRWTLHPKYLDAKGLVALWREALLARAVLRGATKGYRHHPELERFRAHASPRAAINTYLRAVAIEAEKRGYSFDRQKIGPGRRGVALSATQGQLAYEWEHLLRKLKARSPRVYARWHEDARPESHPLFEIVRGASSLGNGGGVGHLTISTEFPVKPADEVERRVGSRGGPRDRGTRC